MQPEDFKEQIRLLTGRPVAKLSAKEDAAIDESLNQVLADEQTIDFSQFNELLLIVNKDRVTEFFFKQFFGESCTVREIPAGVKKFQKTAMRCFGNFIYAYHTLSKVEDSADLELHLGDYCREVKKLLSDFKNRKDTVLNITDISKENTPLLGYLSSGEIRQEHRIATDLSDKLLPQSHSWEDLLFALDTMREKVKDQKKEIAVVKSAIRLVEKFRKTSSSTTTPADLQRRINEHKLRIEERYNTLQETEAVGNKNTDTYLTWDHMDIYFATSMRNSWEYKDLFDFVSKLMKQPITTLPEKLKDLGEELSGKNLTELNVRYFDPTQSYDQNRINKGLVEALMLKRAACTVYSIQDTDTLGKDSELAATLAQGKPVIAYAPRINVEEKTSELFAQSPADLKFRLQFVLYADERDLKPEETSYLLSFLPRLQEFEDKMLFKSAIDVSATKRFQQDNKEELGTFCRILATSEERIYNKRADTLLNIHPLALQVHLDSGVANGVLVVRDIPKCADLLLRILTNTMEFDDPKYDPETDCWLLKEKLTESIFRVVTRNQKLTNCFWNFYRQDDTRTKRR